MDKHLIYCLVHTLFGPYLHNVCIVFVHISVLRLCLLCLLFFLSLLFLGHFFCTPNNNQHSPYQDQLRYIKYTKEANSMQNHSVAHPVTETACTIACTFACTIEKNYNDIYMQQRV